MHEIKMSLEILMPAIIFMLQNVYVSFAHSENTSPYSGAISSTKESEDLMCHTSRNSRCGKEVSMSFDGTEVSWPSTSHDQYSLSNPRCLDETKRFIRRKCEEGCWEPEVAPTCDQIQKLNTCSEGFEMIGNICVLITNSASWSDICLKTGSNYNIDLNYDLLQNIVKYLQKKNIYQFWLPGKQLEEFGPFVWILHSDQWKKSVVGKVQNVSKGNMCLSLLSEYCISCSKIKTTYEALDCATELPMVCLENTTISSLSCPEGLYTTLSMNKQHYCYGFRETHQSLWTEIFWAKDNALYVDNEQVNQILQYAVAKNNLELCWLALVKTKNSFRWRNGSNVGYVNWNVLEDYSESYAAIDNSGTWTLRSNTTRLNCYAQILENVVHRPEIVLQFYPHSQLLELTIYSPNSFFNIDNDVGVSCFTDASLYLYKKVKMSKRWESDWSNYTSVANKSIYEVAMEYYPGNYWCEGVMLKTLDLIRSETVFAHKKYFSHIFSLLAYIPTYVLLSAQINGRYFVINDDNIETIRLQKVLQVYENDTLSIVHMILKEPDVSSNNEQIIEYYNIAKEIVAKINSDSDTKMHIVGMNSTLYCIPEEGSSRKGLHQNYLTWDVAGLGSRITPTELCLQENGLPVYRSCVGDTIFGAAWQNSLENCDFSITPPESTRKLFKLSRLPIQNINCVDSIINQVHDIITNTNITLIPADIYYLGLILEAISIISSHSNKFNNRQNITDIISNISGLNKTAVKLSQIHLNSTNTITHSIQRLLEIIPKQDSSLNDTCEGTKTIRSSEFIYQVSNPAIKNITGLTLFRRNDSKLGNLNDYNIVSVTSNQLLEELLEMNNLEISLWIPQEVLEMINESSDEANKDPIIIVSIYNNDVFFKENRTDALADKVISISMPGYGPHLPVPFSMLFRQSHEGLNLTNTSDSTCSYWNYHPRIENALGKWYTDGCTNTMTHETGDGKIIVCACSHLTNFGQLITGASKSGLDEEEYEKHQKALNIITLIGCSLSIFGLLGIFVMAIIFKSWRRKTGTKVLLHLSTAIGIEMFIIFLFNINAIKVSVDVLNPGFNTERISCIITGVLLHYSVLASFCWMIIIAIMQYLRYVRVLGVIRPMNFVTKSACIAWGCPLMPVLLILLIDPDSYVPESDFEEALCYPSGLSLIIGVILPVAIIVLINLVLYTMVLASIIRKPKEMPTVNSDSRLLSAQLRLSLFLFSLLGLTWMFGLIDAIIGDIVFSYLFSITATLQGFVLFVYFVIIDPATRSLLKCGNSITMNSLTNYT